MTVRRLSILCSTVLLFGLASSASAGGGGNASCGGGAHPHFDDRGTLTWYPTLCEAMQAARAEGKVILMECGRRRCVQCRRLCCQVLPHANVRPRLARITVGFAANCDRMEPAVDAMVRRNLPNANCLPFVAFLRPDGSWITGFAGGRTVDQFLGDLAVAERAWTEGRSVAAETPAVVPVVAERPAPPAPKPCHALAEAAACRGEWREVVRLCREADAKDAVMARLRARAREWADRRLAQALAAAVETRFAEAEGAAAEVGTAMEGEAEGVDARRGVDAVRRAREIGMLAPDSAESAEARRKARAESAGTRWEHLFT